MKRVLGLFLYRSFERNDYLIDQDDGYREILGAKITDSESEWVWIGGQIFYRKLGTLPHAKAFSARWLQRRPRQDNNK
jgi:hypothetical protein